MTPLSVELSLTAVLMSELQSQFGPTSVLIAGHLVGQIANQHARHVGHGGIQGGIASNVVADHAEADVMLRIVAPPAEIEAGIRGCLDEHVTMGSTFKSFGPVEFHVPEGEEAAPVAFGTDAPHLPDWGTPLLFGAGDILDAHTDHEKVARRDLEACAARHERTVRELLAAAEVSR